MRYIKNYKLGYSKDQVVLLSAGNDSTINYESIKQQLKANSNIVEVGRSSRIPSGRLLDSWDAYVMKGDSMAPTDITIKSLSVDEDFIPAYEIEWLREGIFRVLFPQIRRMGLCSMKPR
jgi:putative ABC transport system permease protein